MHRRGRICTGDHLPPSPLLGRGAAGVCCQQHGRSCGVGAHRLWFHDCRISFRTARQPQRGRGLHPYPAQQPCSLCGERPGARQVRLCRKAAGDQSRAAGDGANGLRRSLGRKPIAFSHGGFQSPLLAAYGKAEELLRRPHRAHAGTYPLQRRVHPTQTVGSRTRRMAAGSLASCVISSIGRGLLWAAPCKRSPPRLCRTRDATTATTSPSPSALRTDLWRICCTLANGDRAVAKEYFEVFCGSSIARIDDFKSSLPLAQRQDRDIEERPGQGPSPGNGTDRRSDEAGQRSSDSLRRVDRGDRSHLRYRRSDQNAKNGAFSRVHGRSSMATAPARLHRGERDESRNEQISANMYVDGIF